MAADFMAADMDVNAEAAEPHASCTVFRAPLKIQSSPKCKARKKLRCAAYD